jgi:hypothetical protein
MHTGCLTLAFRRRFQLYRYGALTLTPADVAVRHLPGSLSWEETNQHRQRADQIMGVSLRIPN